MMAQVTRLKRYESHYSGQKRFIHFTFDMDAENAEYVLEFSVDTSLEPDNQEYYIMNTIFSAANGDFTDEERKLFITECFHALGWWS